MKCEYSKNGIGKYEPCEKKKFVKFRGMWYCKGHFKDMKHALLRTQPNGRSEDEP